MSHASRPSSGSAPGRPTVPPPSTTWPTARSGWFALVAAAVGLGSWIVLPILTSFRDTFPVTDTVVMPVIGLVLVVLAAIVNVVTLWLGRQRSAMNIVATVLTVAATLFLGPFVIGEGLGGV